MMLLSDFDFPFDPGLIADRPVEPRDRARLLLVPRGGRGCSHHHVSDLPDLLKPSDVVVVNDTKVLPVRVAGRKCPGGGKIEIVLVRPVGMDSWEVLLKGQVRPGQVIELGRDATATVVERATGRTTVRITSAHPIRALLDEVGLMPLPPYIKRPPSDQDRVWYQTIFARAEGAIAAPTASLHFTPELVAALRAKGIALTTITLHVGPGTFRPVTTARIQDHRMEQEWMEVSEESASTIGCAKARGGRVVAVGTTVVRALESAADGGGGVRPGARETSLFILPGYRFRVVDALLTNFHQPRSTVLMLVSAFAGLECLREAYAEAIRARYRLYSYGDAMLVC